MDIKLRSIYKTKDIRLRLEPGDHRQRSTRPKTLDSDRARRKDI